MSSLMLAEAQQAPAVAARLLAADADTYAALAQAWRTTPPTSLLTVARGSSDHAAGYLAYLAMARLGRLVTSLPMSVVTLYRSRLQTAGLWSLAFSQSGRSPDLVETTQALRAQGAQTLAIVNDTASPLAQAAQWVLPLHAGAERSVAATKSFLAQMVVGARLVSTWADDDGLAAALPQLPAALERAAQQDWRCGVDALSAVERLYVIGRGTGLAAAMEAALKLKETCGLQAEAFSGAEVQHGPMALVGPGFSLLILAPRGPAQASLLQLAQAMRDRGGQVLLAAPQGTPGAELPLVDTGHEDLDAIAAVQSFYPMVEALARARGLDPDAPRHLSKITQTR